jgi:hypothetical protein
MISPTDEPLLRAFARYDYLTAEQIRRLRYSHGSLAYARTRLKRLADAAYLERLGQPHPARTGSAPTVFRLATRGYRVLAHLGVSAIHLPRERPASYLFYRHALALNDLLIAAELMTRRHPSLTIPRLLHERALRRSPVAVRLATGRTVGVIPDAYLRFAATSIDGSGFWYDLLIEVDMGTTAQRAWRHKVEALVAFCAGPYQAVFDAASVTIAVLTPCGDDRAAELLRWTEAELIQLGAPSLGTWFCVAGLDPARIPPQELFRSPCWRQPFASEPTALLALEREEL